jgi:hypothetical protein
MKGKTYTFFIASTPGKLKKLIVPAYILHGIAVLAIIGGITVVAAAGSYSRMLWKVGNYNALRHDQQTLKRQYQELQNTVADTNQRLDSLQSLATEVAMTYGVLRYHPAAFDISDNPVTPQDAFDRSVEQYTFLKRNAAVIAISSGGLRLMPAMSLRIPATRHPSGRCSVTLPIALGNASIHLAVRAPFTLASMWPPITAPRCMPLPMGLSLLGRTTQAMVAWW